MARNAFIGRLLGYYSEVLPTRQAKIFVEVVEKVKE